MILANGNIEKDPSRVKGEVRVIRYGTQGLFLKAF
jgi:hypothetical protein